MQSPRKKSNRRPRRKSPRRKSPRRKSTKKGGGLGLVLAGVGVAGAAAAGGYLLYRRNVLSKECNDVSNPRCVNRLNDCINRGGDAEDCRRIKEKCDVVCQKYQK